MRLVVKRQLLRWFCCGAQRVATLPARFLTAWVTAVRVLLDTWLFPACARAVNLAAPSGSASQPMSAARGEFRTSHQGPAAIAARWCLIGRIEIARLGLSVIVMEGNRPNHAPARGWAYPGHGAAGQIRQHGHRRPTATRFSGRCAISARTTSSRSPRCRASIRYRVVSTKVVSPDDVSVLDPGPE